MTRRPLTVRFTTVSYLCQNAVSLKKNRILEMAFLKRDSGLIF